ncbi:cytochrome c biogenesis protein CcsA [Candidatus Poribacteria bacterium]|nr:cytochrome c biogenesis protein CcsA [Candidatus Poribacteria bacterium]MBT5532343.1 cytochrome c biogenesis protein CcsA [Candidatus Poribacteria bacterium]MBT7097261.1 cytochrome c biogenesis protein CcsA [Candidatus Poribacteria bacterium]
MTDRARETRKDFALVLGFLGVATLAWVVVAGLYGVAVAGLARVATYGAVASSTWACIALYHGLRKGRVGWIHSGRRGVVVSAAFVLFSTFCLLYALTFDWSGLEYVWQTSKPGQPFIYKISALWGGMSGSMLFWVAILAFCALVMTWKSRHEEDELTSYALGALSVVLLFYAVLVAGIIPGIKNPFALIPPAHMAAIQAGQAVRGMGMNPLLQTPAMLIHPPNLYAGFVVCTIPYVYALGALASGSGGTEWITRARRWTIAAWLFLTLGNVIGGAWAYGELGWGGYWGWDPVENAGLLPWLMITAFLHSVIIQEHRNMLKVWNVILIALTFLLVLFGTTLVRSGLLSSIHAFGQSTELIVYFLSFLGLNALVVGVMLWRRWNTLRSMNRFDSLLSREASFLLNNWIFVVGAVVVFAGTTFPLISKSYYTYIKGIENREIAVTEPYYNTFIVPLGLILLLLTGIGPMISWKKATESNLRRNFLAPTLVGGLAAALSVYPFYKVGAAHPDGVPLLKTTYAILCIFASAFVLATVAMEYYKGVRVRMHRGAGGPIRAFIELNLRNKRRYGGYIVHVGMVLFYLGTLGAKGFQMSHRVVLQPGESYQVAGYTLTLGDQFLERGGESAYSAPRGVKGAIRASNAQYKGVNIEATRAKGDSVILRPALGIYDGHDGPPTYESAILRRGTHDLYIALGEVTQAGAADMQVFYNPFAWVVLLLAPFVMLVGSLVCLGESGKGRKKKEGSA